MAIKTKKTPALTQAPVQTPVLTQAPALTSGQYKATLAKYVSGIKTKGLAGALHALTNLVPFAPSVGALAHTGNKQNWLANSNGLLSNTQPSTLLNIFTNYSNHTCVINTLHILLHTCAKYGWGMVVTGFSPALQASCLALASQGLPFVQHQQAINKLLGQVVITLSVSQAGQGQPLAKRSVALGVAKTASVVNGVLQQGTMLALPTTLA